MEADRACSCLRDVRENELEIELGGPRYFRWLKSHYPHCTVKAVLSIIIYAFCWDTEHRLRQLYQIELNQHLNACR